LQTHKILQGISIPYSALVSVIFGLMIFSFPIGAYLFFNSPLGGSIEYGFPVSELEVVQKYGLDLPSWVSVGDVFVVVWMFFLIIFTIAVFGPKKNFVQVLSPMMSGARAVQEGNYLLHAIQWFCVIIVLSAAIDLAQQRFGVSITPPQFENDLVQFLRVSVAPVVEEIGFRTLLIGIPLFLFYSHKLSGKQFFKTLWNPSASLSIHSHTKAIALIVAVGVFFGAAHVMSEQWSQGKFAQATMSGIIIGWVYYRYGFVASLLIHWATNYVIFSYGYLVSVVNEVRFIDSFSHSLIQTIEVLFVITGVLSISIMALRHREKKLEAQGQL
jgi:hypothetical protein